MGDVFLSLLLCCGILDWIPKGVNDLLMGEGVCCIHSRVLNPFPVSLDDCYSLWIPYTRLKQAKSGAAAYLEIVYGEPDGETLPETGSDRSVRLANVMSRRRGVRSC